MKNTSVAGTIRLILLPIFLVALIAGAGGFYWLLRHYSIERAAADARLVLTTAAAIRAYTEDQVGPDLSRAPSNTFYEATVPAFAAQNVFKRVQQSNRAYSYREPTLNPTNPADRPTPFEVEIIDSFRANSKMMELTGIRDSSAGRVFYLAHPIRITDPGCLTCHSTPQAAPAAMLAKYGSSNGFGWHLNEVVGAQTLTVPIAEGLQGSAELTISLIIALIILFAITYVAIIYALHMTFVRPLRDLAQAADVGSITSAEGLVIADSGTTEIRQLAEAIRRLRTSLVKAMRWQGSAASPPQS